MKILGQIGYWDESQIIGWIAHTSADTQPLELEVLIDGRVIGRCQVNVFRPDLLAQGHHGGRCGFRFVFPPDVDPAAARHARVRFGGSGLYLEASRPRQLEPWRTGDKRKFRSAFGGLWIDRYDWIDILGERHRKGEISDDVADQVMRFVRDGYIIMPGAVPAVVIDEVERDIESFWHRPPKGLLVSTTEPDNKFKMVPPNLEYRTGKTKLLDLYVFSRAARQAVGNAPTVAFLSAVFQDRPKAFQGLSFWNGSEQDMHKDTAYVRVKENPLAMVASWLALEDVEEGTGELEYYVGSHLAPDFLFGGVSKWMVSEGGDFSADHTRFLASLHEDAKRNSCTKVRFLPRRGDVLLWHADLAHGGSRVAKKGRTRKSLVTHFCPSQLTPNYMNGVVARAVQEGDCEFASAHSPQYLDTISRRLVGAQ